MSELKEHIDAAVAYMEEQLGGRKPVIGMVLGSGLNPLAEEIEDAVIVSYDDVPFMRSSTNGMHKGCYVCGMLEGRLVIAMQGRLHLYEGYTAEETAFPMWVMASLGIESVIVTNASGGINESYHVGDFCITTDHINFTAEHPLAMPYTAEMGTRYFSMTDAYDPQLRALAHEVADECGVPVQDGVYLALRGPSFETPAEIKAFRIWGADTVGMSTVNEILAARQMGVRILCISLISNMAAGIEGASPSEEELVESGRNAEANFALLMRGIVAKM